MKKLIRVTKDDIRFGKKYNCIACPIAQAAKRKFPDEKIEVGLRTLWIGNKFLYLSSKAEQFIFDFDSGRKVSPISFYIDLDKLSSSY